MHIIHYEHITHTSCMHTHAYTPTHSLVHTHSQNTHTHTKHTYTEYTHTCVQHTHTHIMCEHAHTRISHIQHTHITHAHTCTSHIQHTHITHTMTEWSSRFNPTRRHVERPFFLPCLGQWDLKKLPEQKLCRSLQNEQCTYFNSPPPHFLLPPPPSVPLAHYVMPSPVVSENFLKETKSLSNDSPLFN